MTTTQDLYDDVVRLEEIALRAGEAATITADVARTAKRDVEAAHARLTQAVRQDPSWVWPAFRGGDCT